MNTQIIPVTFKAKRLKIETVNNLNACIFFWTFTNYHRCLHPLLTAPGVLLKCGVPIFSYEIGDVSIWPQGFSALFPVLITNALFVFQHNLDGIQHAPLVFDWSHDRE